MTNHTTKLPITISKAERFPRGKGFVLEKKQGQLFMSPLPNSDNRGNAKEGFRIKSLARISGTNVYNIKWSQFSLLILSGILACGVCLTIWGASLLLGFTLLGLVAACGGILKNLVVEDAIGLALEVQIAAADKTIETVVIAKAPRPLYNTLYNRGHFEGKNYEKSCI